jgi:hypothetical protein
VDHGIEAAELVDFRGYSFRPGDGKEIAGDNPPSAGCRREGVATSTLASPVQYDVMALVDQEPGRQEAQTIR